MKLRFWIKFLNINTFLLALIIFNTQSVNACEFSATLIDKNLQWKNDEYITGGRIAIDGGHIYSFKQTRILGLVHNHPKESISLLNLIYYQPSGSPPNKAGEYPFLKNWFIIKTTDENFYLEKNCSIKIQGELDLEKNSFGNSINHRKISINNSDFILEKLPNY